jgi:hypothetical protein
MPWPVFIGLANRVSRFEARRRLAIMDGTAWGAARVFSREGGQLDAGRGRLEYMALGKG